MPLSVLLYLSSFKKSKKCIHRIKRDLSLRSFSEFGIAELAIVPRVMSPKAGLAPKKQTQLRAAEKARFVERSQIRKLITKVKSGE